MASLYARVFLQILDSSLAENMDARHLFEDLLKLASRDGVVDMTRDAIARRLNAPIEWVNRGIAFLEAPDERSRNPSHDGRRLLRLSDTRDWGWRITNFEYYDRIRTEAEHQASIRERVAKYRARKKAEVALPPLPPTTDSQPQTQTQTQGVAYNLLHGVTSEPEEPSDQPELGVDDSNFTTTADAVRVLQALNVSSGRKFRGSDATMRMIRARLNEQGVTLDGVLKMVERQCAMWRRDEKMAMYMRPETLFNATKFESYYAQRDEPVTIPHVSAAAPPVPAWRRIKSLEDSISDFEIKAGRMPDGPARVAAVSHLQKLRHQLAEARAQEAKVTA